MTTTSPATSAQQHPAQRTLSGWLDVVRSEFCKLHSVRSTLWTLGGGAAANVLVAALIALFLPSHLSLVEKSTLDSVRVSLAGLHLSQIAFGVLGALVVTSEYSSGMIRASLAAVPRRRQLLAAKALVFTSAALVAGILSSFAAYFVFQLCLSDDALQTSIGDPGVLRAVTGGGLYLTTLGLLGLGLGAVLRSSAGAIATLLGMLFVPPILISVLPATWQDNVGRYLPMMAGDTIYSLHHEANALGPWTGFAVFCLYAVAALIAAFLLITRRDA
jgi:ABC-2 type transport system permease protein